MRRFRWRMGSRAAVFGGRRSWAGWAGWTAAAVFSLELGRAALDEEVDYLRLRSYAQPFGLDTGWHLYMAPTDGQRSVVAEGTGGLDGGRPQGEPLRLAPEERCVILPLIETVAAAEYTGTALSLQVSMRPRISEIL